MSFGVKYEDKGDISAAQQASQLKIQDEIDP